jgi:hypothetical protein
MQSPPHTPVPNTILFISVTIFCPMTIPHALLHPNMLKFISYKIKVDKFKNCLNLLSSPLSLQLTALALG